MDFRGDTAVRVSLMKGAGNRVPQNLIAVGLWALLGQEHSCEICKAEAKQGLLPLKDFRKVCSLSQDRLFVCMEKPLEAVWVDPQVV